MKLVEARKLRSNWWFLLPIVFSVIGGVIAYFVLKEDDPRKAKNCLLLGIILTAIGLGISMLMTPDIPVPDVSDIEINV